METRSSQRPKTVRCVQIATNSLVLLQSKLHKGQQTDLSVPCHRVWIQPILSVKFSIYSDTADFRQGNTEKSHCRGGE